MRSRQTAIPPPSEKRPIKDKGGYMLNTGTKAPAFTLPDKDGNAVSLSDFLGSKVVLYFYPKIILFCAVLT